MSLESPLGTEGDGMVKVAATDVKVCDDEAWKKAPAKSESESASANLAAGGVTRVPTWRTGVALRSISAGAATATVLRSAMMATDMVDLDIFEQLAGWTGLARYAETLLD